MYHFYTYDNKQTLFRFKWTTYSKSLVNPWSASNTIITTVGTADFDMLKMWSYSLIDYIIDRYHRQTMGGFWSSKAQFHLGVKLVPYI